MGGLRWGLTVALVTELAAACSGGGDESNTSTTNLAAPATSGAATTTTAPALPVPVPTPPSFAGPTTSLGPAPPELRSPKINDRSTVSTVGIGGLTFGLTVPQAQNAIGMRLLTESGAAPSGECYYVRPESGPDGVFFMVSKSTVERVDVRSGNVKTRSGLGIGTTVEQLKTALKEQLQQSGTTFTFVPTSANDANFRIIFETDGTKVTWFRAGRLSVVTDPKGC